MSWYVFESINPTCNLCQRQVSVLDVRKKRCLFCTYLSNTRQSAIPLNAILKLLIVFCMPSFNIQMHSFGCKYWVIFQVFGGLIWLVLSSRFLLEGAIIALRYWTQNNEVILQFDGLGQMLMQKWLTLAILYHTL